jgi:hypothetical protein
MPILLLGSGLVLVIVGLNGNAAQLYSLIASDFQGANSFVYWMLAIVILGALGYVKGLENFSKAFLILVLIVLFLDNGGFFQQFQAFLKTTQTASTTASSTTASTATGS